MAGVIDLKTGAEELRSSWQGLILLLTLYVDAGDIIRPKGRMGMCVLSLLAHNFDDAMPALLRARFGTANVGTPFLTSIARVDKTGRIIANMIDRDGYRVLRQPLFRSLQSMQNSFRELADTLALSDDERIALFDAVRKWCPCDERLDPNMDRLDPDAKRLTVN